MSDGEDACEELSHIQAKMTKLEQLLWEHSVDTEQPLQHAQVLLARMDAALTVGRLLHKLDGNESLSTQVYQAEQRVFEAYSKKVTKAQGRQELSHQRKRTEVNVDAMHRFIEHTVTDLDHGQKQQLKQVAQTAASKRDGKAHEAMLVKDGKPNHLKSIGVQKGLSASERATKRRKKAKQADEQVAAMLDDLMPASGN